MEREAFTVTWCMNSKMSEYFNLSDFNNDLLETTHTWYTRYSRYTVTLLQPGKAITLGTLRTAGPF